MGARNRPASPGVVSNAAVGAASQGSARFPLSGSPLGRAIQLSTGASTVHTLSQGVIEEVYLWCANYSTTEASLYLNFDGNSSFATATSLIIKIGAQSGLNLVWPGIPHQPPEPGDTGISNNNPNIFAKASVNSKLLLYGFVVRHYPRDRANTAVAGFNFGGQATE